MAAYGFVSVGVMGVQMAFIARQFSRAPFYCTSDSTGALCRSNKIYLFSNCLFITSPGFAGPLLRKQKKKGGGVRREGKGMALNNEACQGTCSL